MRTRFTQDDLILYIYDELGAPTKAAIENALQIDPALKSSYMQLREAVNCLDEYEVSPSDSSVDIILEHSIHLEHSTDLPAAL